MNDPDDEDQFPNGNPFFRGPHRNGPDDFFRTPSLFTEPRDLFHHFEEIFRNLGMIEFPAIEGIPEGTIEGDTDANRNQSPRDNMLREPEEPSHRQGSPFSFGRFWGSPYSQMEQPSIKLDTDLDEKVAKSGLDSILKRDEQQRPMSVFRSVQVTKVKRPDGTIEEKKVVRDGEGHEETVITRSMHDQSHSITTRKGPEGTEETIENFTNLDEDELPKFDRNWFEKDQVPLWSPQQLPRIERPPLLDQEAKSLFDKYFSSDAKVEDKEKSWFRRLLDW